MSWKLYLLIGLSCFVFIVIMAVVIYFLYDYFALDSKNAIGGPIVELTQIEPALREPKEMIAPENINISDYRLVTLDLKDSTTRYTMKRNSDEDIHAMRLEVPVAISYRNSDPAVCSYTYENGYTRLFEDCGGIKSLLEQMLA